MWNQQQYEKISKSIATEFVGSEGGSTINSQAVKVAADEGLVPEQIRTMVRLANVETFQQLFAQKTGSDKMIEFEPGDAEVVINQLKEAAEEKCDASGDSCTCEDATKCTCATKEAAYDRAQDFYGQLYPPEPLEKKAAAPEEIEELPNRHPKEVQLLLKDASDKLRIDQYEAAFVWKDRLEKAAQAFKLLLFQGMIGCDVNAPVPSTEKVAQICETHVAVLDPAHRQVVTFLKEAQGARVNYLECQSSREVLAQYVARLEV